MFEREGLTTPEQIEQMRTLLGEADHNHFSKNKSKRIARGKRLIKYIRTFSFLLVTALLISTLANVLITKKRGEIPNIFGLYIFSIESASMEPTLMVGNLILSRKLSDFSDLPVGAVVTFKDEDDRVITHRIIGQTADQSGQKGYITKGDNPINSPDSEILLPDQIVAVYVLKINLPFA